MEMTVKEYNALLHNFFECCMDTDILGRHVNFTGFAYVYEIMQGDKHAIEVLYAPSQMNDKLLCDLGFDPEMAKVKLRMIVSGKTQTVILKPSF